MSGILATAKAMFEHLYLVPGLVPICALCHHALGAHTPTAHAPAVLDLCAIFFRVALELLCQHDLPSNLAQSRRGYKDSARLLGESC